ncbi:hypothetical protein EVAR_89592_1 [Eumeta japonica]|uniref:Uncharacterized protein n=1 Tax=Eumeta variegata TaxID=151549 RepID=A0A4C1XKW7_EUMVA|nr:hypothetical protein EVAR_89592_1 [Eumeta japonica]
MNALHVARQRVGLLINRSKTSFMSNSIKHPIGTPRKCSARPSAYRQPRDRALQLYTRAQHRTHAQTPALYMSESCVHAAMCRLVPSSCRVGALCAGGVPGL